MTNATRQHDARYGRLTPASVVYLSLSVLGTVIPYLFFVTHFRAEGFGLGTFAQALFSNGAAGGFSADVLVSSVVFWVWLYRSDAERPWLFVLLNLSIGLSCAFPAYLYDRERKLAGGWASTDTSASPSNQD